jgi:biotin operon repressor
MPHTRIDELERRLVGRDQAPEDIAASLGLDHEEVVDALLEVGLEVEDRVKDGYELSATAEYTGRAIDYTPAARTDSTVTSRREAHFKAVFAAYEESMR